MTSVPCALAELACDAKTRPRRRRHSRKASADAGMSHESKLCACASQAAINSSRSLISPCIDVPLYADGVRTHSLAMSKPTQPICRYG